MCCGSLIAVGRRHASLPGMPRRLIPLALAAALCWTTGTAGHAANAATPAVVPVVEPGDDNWSAVPLSSGSAKDRPVIYLEGAPGSVLKDAVVLTNSGEEERTYRLSGAAAPGFPDSSAKDWFSFAEPRVTVPANTRAEVPFTLTIPANGTPGDHPGQVQVEQAGRTADVPVRLRVAGETLPALAVENVRVEGEGIRYTVVNRGNTVLSPRLALHAEGWRGTVAKKKAKPLGVTLAPGERVTRTEQWPGAPVLERVDLTLTVTAGGGAQATVETRESTIPWTPLGLAVLVLLGGGVLWLVRRARLARVRGPGSQPTASSDEGSEDTEPPSSGEPRPGIGTGEGIDTLASSGTGVRE